VEADQVDVLAFAVLRYFEQVEDTEKSGGAGELRSDFGKADGLDGVNFYFAFFHAVTVADFDVGTHPDADARSDFAAANAFSEALGEHHAGILRR